MAKAQMTAQTAAQKVNLKRYTYDYIVSRKDALIEAAGDRDTQMDRYEKMYRFEFWKDAKADDEYRVTTPIAFDVVEKNRALLMAKLPTLSVPAANVNDPVEVDRAQRKEKFLYGVSWQANLLKVMAAADWFANALGIGHIKCVNDQYAGADEAPIVVTAPDPRTVYGRMNATRDRYLELVQTWDRSRADIEQDWDFQFERPATGNEDEIATWLDETVTYTEYWAAVAVFEDRDMGQGLGQLPPVGMSPAAISSVGPSVATMAGIELPRVAGPLAGSVAAASGPVADTDIAAPVAQRVWRVVHAVVVEDSSEGAAGGASGGETGIVVKQPMVMVGYDRIPFFTWSGIETPLGEGREGLSVLYPLAGGDAPEDGGGVLQTLNMLMSLDLDLSVRAAHSPLITDDRQAVIDLAPDAVNLVDKGSRWEFLVNPGTNPSIQRLTEQVKLLVNRTSIPDVLAGERMMNLSGQAITAFGSAFELVIAQRQHDRERALSQMYTHVLRLARTYADPVLGWSTYGIDISGKTINATILKDDVSPTDWVQVKLSSAMPKDIVGMVMMLFQLWKGGGISQEWFLDMAQQYLGHGSTSPQEEIDRIRREQAPVAAPMTAPTPPMGAPMGTPTGGAGMSPTGGMPPSALPPTPEMVGAAGNLAGMLNMMGGGGGAVPPQVR